MAPRDAEIGAARVHAREPEPVVQIRLRQRLPEPAQCLRADALIADLADRATSRFGQRQGAEAQNRP